jgi:hypothetical protein
VSQASAEPIKSPANEHIELPALGISQQAIAGIRYRLTHR